MAAVFAFFLVVVTTFVSSEIRFTFFMSSGTCANPIGTNVGSGSPPQACTGCSNCKLPDGITPVASNHFDCSTNTLTSYSAASCSGSIVGVTTFPACLNSNSGYLFFCCNPVADECLIGPSAATSTPIASPVTSTPSASPVTSKPTGSPVTSKPTKSPVTSKPTKSPVTSKPTGSPITSKPTASPIAAFPTAAPSSTLPTAAPVPSSNVCKPQYGLTNRGCTRLMKKCDRLGYAMKWNGQKCPSLTGGRPAASGCQCLDYCGYSCQKACVSDDLCYWENGACYNTKTRQRGSVFSRCPFTGTTTVP